MVEKWRSWSMNETIEIGNPNPETRVILKVCPICQGTGLDSTLLFKCSCQKDLENGKT
jgi:hypothetical protein